MPQAEQDKRQAEPNPDWSKATSDQMFEYLMAIRPGEPESKRIEALRKMPQKDEATQA